MLFSSGSRTLLLEDEFSDTRSDKRALITRKSFSNLFLVFVKIKDPIYRHVRDFGWEKWIWCTLYIHMPKSKTTLNYEISLIWIYHIVNMGSPMGSNCPNSKITGTFSWGT